MAALSHLSSVLVTEDDYFIASYIDSALRAHGCASTEMVNNAAAAYGRLAAAKFDLVLVDIKLIDGDCVGVVAYLHDHGIPFIYATGCEPSERPPQPAPWLSKPFSEEDLLLAIQSIEDGRDHPGPQEGREVW